MSEKLVLEAFERGKMFGYAEGLKASKAQIGTIELADELWVCLESSIISDSDTRDLIMDAANLLRQQQAEIEALEEQLAIMKNDLAFAGHDFNKIILQLQKAQEK